MWIRIQLCAGTYVLCAATMEQITSGINETNVDLKHKYIDPSMIICVLCLPQCDNLSQLAESYVNSCPLPSRLAKSLLPACCVTADFKEIDLPKKPSLTEPQSRDLLRSDQRGSHGELSLTCNLSTIYVSFSTLPPQGLDYCITQPRGATTILETGETKEIAQYASEKAGQCAEEGEAFGRRQDVRNEEQEGWRCAKATAADEGHVQGIDERRGKEKGCREAAA